MREFLTIAKALADESRTRTLLFLHGGELCVCELIDLLGLAPSTVSKHMAILYHAGLVETRKDGRWVYYRLAGEGGSPCALDAIQWLRACAERDAQMAEHVGQVKKVHKMSRSKLCECYRK
jgi:DNA-binding transcriptional ArsR family regulator